MSLLAGGPADGPPPSLHTHAQYPANTPTPTEADTQKKTPGKAPAWFRGEGSPFSHRCILVSPPTWEGYRSLASKEEL